MRQISRLMWVTVAACGWLAAGCVGDDKGGPAAPVATAPKLPEANSSEVKMDDSGFPVLPPGAGAIDPEAPREFTETSSGLKYRILRESEGKKPSASSNVVAHYMGWVDNGTKFDSSYDRREPTPFPLNGVIKGWTEGLQLIGEGGMIELEIPGKLGYPEGRPPVIAPNATLHFLVELKQVK